MALFGNIENAKDQQLAKILSGTAKNKTLEEIQNDISIQQEQSDPPMGSPLGDATVPVTNQVNQATPQPVSLATQPKIPPSPISMEQQQMNNQATMFGQLAQMQQTDPFDAVLGDKPTIDQERLKRAKTQDLINAFGDIAKVGAGSIMLATGCMPTSALTNPKDRGISAIKGVYDDYYKELADYRDKESRVALAKIQDESRKASEKARMDFDREKFEATQRANQERLDEQARQFNITTELNQKDRDRRFALEQKNLELKIQANKDNAKRLNLDYEKFLEQQLQNDRAFNQFYINLDEERKASADALLLKQIEIEQIIKRNNTQELKTGFDAVKEGRDALVDTYSGLTYGDAITEFRNNPDTQEGRDAKRYIDSYNELAELEQILFTRLRGDNQVTNQVTTSESVEQTNPSDSLQKSVSDELNNIYGKLDADFTESLFGKGMGAGGTLNVTNLQNAITYLENPQNLFKIQEKFGFSDDELETKRQELLFNLNKNIRQIQSLNQ